MKTTFMKFNKQSSFFFFIFGATLWTTLFVLSSCSQEIDVGDPDIPVADLVIKDIDSTNNAINMLRTIQCTPNDANTSDYHPLESFVLPSDSADQRTVWSSSDISTLRVIYEIIKNIDGSQTTKAKLCWSRMIAAGTQVAVTATSANNPKKKQTVTVNAASAIVPVTGVNIIPGNSNLRKGFNKNFKDALSPSTYNTTITKREWTIDKSGITNPGDASINANGEVNALQAGDVKIKFTITQDCSKPGTPSTCNNTVSGTVVLTVTPLPAVDNITLNPEDVVLADGGTQEVNATILPSDSDPDQRELIWTTSDTDITITHLPTDTDKKNATITMVPSNVSAKKTITVTVKAKYPKAGSVAQSGKTFKVTLLPSIQPVSMLSCTSTNSHTIAKTNVLNPVTVITPSNATVVTHALPNSPVKWSILAESPANSAHTPVITLDKNTGKVIAQNAGLAVIVAKVPVKPNSSEFKECTHSIEVKETITEVSSIALDKSSLLFIRLNETQNLTATLTPASPSNSQILWISDNPSVATVSQSGVVTSHKLGEATIKALALGGIDKIAETKVRVIAFEQTTTDINDPRITTDFIRFSTALGQSAFSAVTFPNQNWNGSTGTSTISRDFYIGKTELTYLVYAAIYDWATTPKTGDPTKRAADGGPIYKITSRGAIGAAGAGRTAENPHSSGDSLWQPATYFKNRSVIAWLNALTEWYNKNVKPSAAPDLTCVYTISGNCYRNDSVAPSSTDETQTGFRLPSRKEWYFAATWIGANSNLSAGQTNVVKYGGVNYTNKNSASGAACEVKFSSGSGTLANPYPIPDHGDTCTLAVGWFNSNRTFATPIAPYTSNVAKKPANKFGCYDMSGNVHELIRDNGSTNYASVGRVGGGIGAYWYEELDFPSNRKLGFYKNDTINDKPNYENGMRIVRTVP